MTEIDAFHAFVNDQVALGECDDVDDLVRRFRERQEEVARLRKELQLGLDQASRGESRELDINEVIARGEKRLAEKGISD